MRTKDYREIVIQHMESYKKNFLGITKRGIYKNSPKDYGHILPKTKEENGIPIYNLLPSIDIKDEILKEIKYHEYAHHLNSSQLMCINFFLPITKDKILLKLLKQVTNLNFSSDSEIKEIAFEKSFSKRDSTNFDLYIEISTGEKIYLEIKYTEQDFGGNCYDNGILKEKYENKYNDYYEKCIQDSLMDIKGKEEFFRDYQINRNISYIKDKNDYVIFILPFDSEDLLNEVKNIVRKNISLENQVKIVDWKELCKIALRESKNTIFHQHFNLFKDKYII
ncbi:PGN_0703 family putative restriction endonuclease [Clostridium nigeriense]|uniref:PGN_0703 family putative restriction endonuclease n=1 Tax=Clostridium nigeriense TaxID=1805470 RepID=UPI000834C062|nr:hypothetical protein [Clostridium nigeriense]